MCVKRGQRFVGASLVGLFSMRTRTFSGEGWLGMVVSARARKAIKSITKWKKGIVSFNSFFI